MGFSCGVPGAWETGHRLGDLVDALNKAVEYSLFRERLVPKGGNSFMDSQYVMGIDLGTTGIRAVIVNRAGQIIADGYREHTQIYPQPGWVEHDPMEYWVSLQEVAAGALSKANLLPQQIAGIGLGDMGETILIWDKSTGEPLYNAIVWQDRRTSGLADELKSRPGVEEMIRRKTGLVLDCYFSATKIKWMMDNVPQVQNKIKSGEALCGTTDAWLIWKLTGGAAYPTNYSTCSRTMLFNIHTLEWDDEILSLFGIPRGILPLPGSPFQYFGHTAPEAFFGHAVPVSASAVDTAAALCGQACFKEGMIKASYGTGCFLYMNTGDKPIPAQDILTTIAWSYNDEMTYALDGGVYITGAAMQWLRDGLKIIESASQSEAMALSIPDSGDVFFVPAFTGLAAPQWDPHARGTIVGITGGTQKEHIVRAALEATAFQVRGVVDTMRDTSGLHIPALRVDGGQTANDFLMQFQADLLGIPVEVSAFTELTALGAAQMAGLTVGVWSTFGELEQLWKPGKIFEPKISRSAADLLYADWLEAVDRSRGWANRKTQ